MLHGTAEVSMVRLVPQIAAEGLNCMVPPQRDNEQLDICFQHRFQQSEVLNCTAKVNIMKLALHMTTEVDVQKQVLQGTVMVSRYTSIPQRRPQNTSSTIEMRTGSC